MTVAQKIAQDWATETYGADSLTPEELLCAEVLVIAIAKRGIEEACGVKYVGRATSSSIHENRWWEREVEDVTSVAASL
jgi:hypothetical protein